MLVLAYILLYREREDGMLADLLIGLPLIELIQRIAIGVEILRECLLVNGAIEHLAQCQSIHHAAVNSKADDSARKLIHHHQNPITL